MASQLEELCAMFSQLDTAVVEIVLESCGNDPAKAIDQLLAMSEEQECAGNRRKQGEQQEQEVEVVELQENDGEKDAETWRKRIPEDFLRLPKNVKVRLQDEIQIQQDLMIAQMLANEGFRRELAQHAEFRGQLEREKHDDSFDWSTAWNELSESAKTKFNALATRFRSGGEYRALESSESDPYLNAMLPSNGSSARNRRKPGSGTSQEEGIEMDELGAMSRMKIQ